MEPTLRWASRSDTGRVRLQNEDSVHADGDVFIVADGMGGHLAGEVASALAVSTIVEKCSGGVASLDHLGEAVREANRRVIGESGADPNREGMGTTVVAVARMGDPGDPRLALANVGDSRAYLFDSSGIRQLSKDHSLVQELVDDGIIGPEDARHHPRRNIVTRALGIDPEVAIDLWELALPIGSRILLCSDGLVDEVEEAAIAEVLTSEPDPEIAADRLIRLANDNGGRDNVSLVLLQMVGGSAVTDPTAEIELVSSETAATDMATNVGKADGDKGVMLVPGEMLDESSLPKIVERIMALKPVGKSEKESDRAPRRTVRSRFRWGLVLLVLLVGVTIGGALSASAIRSGFTVTFDSEGDVVVLRGHDVLWFAPTVEARGPAGREALDAVSRDLVGSEPEFDTLDQAVDFIVERLSSEAGR